MNGDGVVNFEDYEAVVTKLATAAGVGPGDHFYDETVRYQKEVFQVISVAIILLVDTILVVVFVVDTHASIVGLIYARLFFLAQFLMDHADVDHDGKIDCGEFANWATGKSSQNHVRYAPTVPDGMLTDMCLDTLILHLKFLIARYEICSMNNCLKECDIVVK